MHGQQQAVCEHLKLYIGGFGLGPIGHMVQMINAALKVVQGAGGQFGRPIFHPGFDR